MTTEIKRTALIEEAAKAMYFEDCGFAALDDDAEPFRDMARVAFAVFEQAHAEAAKRAQAEAEVHALRDFAADLDRYVGTALNAESAAQFARVKANGIEREARS